MHIIRHIALTNKFGSSALKPVRRPALLLLTGMALVLVGWTPVAMANGGCPATGATVEYIDIDGISCSVLSVIVTDGNVQAKGCPTCTFIMGDTLVMDGDVQVEGFDSAKFGRQSGGNCSFNLLGANSYSSGYW